MMTAMFTFLDKIVLWPNMKSLVREEAGGGRTALRGHTHLHITLSVLRKNNMHSYVLGTLTALENAELIPITVMVRVLHR